MAKKQKPAAAKPRRRSTAAAPTAPPANAYPGKQHYPRCVYKMDGTTMIHRIVHDEATHAALNQADPGWVKYPHELGVETAPAAADVLPGVKG